MSLAAKMYPLLKPWLFRLDAERAHVWTTKMMRVAHAFGLLGETTGTPGMGVEVMGLGFPNQVGLAAGMDKGAECVDAWGAVGFGFVEVGTLTPRPQPGNPKPRLFRLPEHEALINRLGFNNPGVEVAVKRLEKRRFQGVVGVNIGKNFDTPNEDAVEDYRKCLRAAYGVADYIAVNISSPNTKGLRDLQGEESIRRLLSALQTDRETLSEEQGCRVPIAVKIAPDLSEEQVEALARVFNELSVDGVIATNTTISRPMVGEDRLAEQTGGLSGRPVFEKSNEILQAFRSSLKPGTPIIGVGGVLSGASALEKVRRGADLVQVYSGLVYRGPALVKEVAEALSD
jgi:dihydroorotate dehydrogenase